MQENMWLFQKGHLVLNFDLGFSKSNLVGRARDPLVLRASEDYKLLKADMENIYFDHTQTDQLTEMLKRYKVAQIAYTRLPKDKDDGDLQTKRVRIRLDWEEAG